MSMNKGSATEEEILRFAQDDREPRMTVVIQERLGSNRFVGERRMTGRQRSPSPVRMGLPLFRFIICQTLPISNISSSPSRGIIAWYN
jgi:hypothetical protein